MLSLMYYTVTSSATCSLMTSDFGLCFSLQWPSSFNSQHAVGRSMYRVSVDPDPFSCSSDQVIPSEDYSCPGLSPERNYSITVSAINCGDQEGESDTFTILPQLLGTGLTHHHVVRCSFYGVADYTLIFEGSAGEMVEVKVVSSDDSCMNGSCFTSFSSPMASPPCQVCIMARNAFGRSKIVLDNVCKLAIQH